MLTTKRRLPGISLFVGFGEDGTYQGCWESVKYDSSAKFATPTSADSPIVQKVITEKDTKGSVSYWLGAEQPMTLRAGDEMFIIEIKEGVNDVSEIIKAMKDEDYEGTKIRVVGSTEEYMKEPAKGTFNFECGFID